MGGVDETFGSDVDRSVRLETAGLQQIAKLAPNYGFEVMGTRQPLIQDPENVLDKLNPDKFHGYLDFDLTTIIAPVEPMYTKALTGLLDEFVGNLRHDKHFSQANVSERLRYHRWGRLVFPAALFAIEGIGPMTTAREVDFARGVNLPSHQEVSVASVVHANHKVKAYPDRFIAAIALRADSPAGVKINGDAFKELRAKLPRK